MELNRWKLVAGGAALVGASLGAVAVADADDGGGFRLNERAAIALADDARGVGAGADAGTSGAVSDGSPESADSPNESVQDSAASPFDSPDDPGWVDPSPESAHSPNESAQDSPIPPPPAPAPIPPPPPAASADSPAPAPAPAPASFDSPDSGGS